MILTVTLQTVEILVMEGDDLQLKINSDDPTLDFCSKFFDPMKVLGITDHATEIKQRCYNNSDPEDLANYCRGDQIKSTEDGESGLTCIDFCSDSFDAHQVLTKAEENYMVVEFPSGSDISEQISDSIPAECLEEVEGDWDQSDNSSKESPVSQTAAEKCHKRDNKSVEKSNAFNQRDHKSVEKSNIVRHLKTKKLKKLSTNPPTVFHDKTENCSRESSSADSLSSVNKGTNNNNKLKSKLIVKFKSNEFKCDICSKLFKSKRVLTDHQVLHQNRDSKPFQCPICNMRFAVKRYLTSHSKTHIENEKYECEICGTICKAKKYLSAHMKTHDSTMYNCDLCSAVFSQKRYLSVHLQHTHKSEDSERLSCTYCETTFKEKRYLKEHLLTHTAPTEFKCDKCDMVFSRKRYLRDHKSVHSDKVYIINCDTCFKMFKKQKHYENHKCVPI